MKSEEKNNLHGYLLFLDVEDKLLQAHNRAVCMSNIFEDNSRNGLSSDRGLALLKEYFELIPENERITAYAEFQSLMESRGYVFTKQTQH